MHGLLKRLELLRHIHDLRVLIQQVENTLHEDLKNGAHAMDLSLTALTNTVSAFEDGVSAAIARVSSLQAEIDAGSENSAALQAELDALTARIKEGTDKLAAGPSTDQPAADKAPEGEADPSNGTAA